MTMASQSFFVRCIILKHRLVPLLQASTRASGTSSSCGRRRRISLGFWHTIGTSTRLGYTLRPGESASKVAAWNNGSALLPSSVALPQKWGQWIDAAVRQSRRYRAVRDYHRECPVPSQQFRVPRFSCRGRSSVMLVPLTQKWCRAPSAPCHLTHCTVFYEM